jgi:hypothetical protein
MPIEKISDYEPVLAPTFGILNSDFCQPGDPRKGAERIVDMLTGDGFAKEKMLPSRVSLGDDACESTMAALKSREAILRDWSTWSTGTNF